MVDVVLDRGQAIWRLFCSFLGWPGNRRTGVSRDPVDYDATFEKWARMKGRDTW